MQPFISWAALLTAAAALGKAVILTRLTASVKHEFDERLERFRSDLKDKESELQMLRNHALSGLKDRQSALQAKQFEAIDQLWAAWSSFAGLRLSLSIVGTMKYDEMLKISKTDPNMRGLFADLDVFDLKSVKLDGDMARPYVSPLAWAIFQAYSVLLITGVMKIKQAKHGVGTPLFDDEGITRILKAVLPEHTALIDEIGVGAYPSLLGPLEEKFLSELASMLKGEASEQSSMDQAKKILVAINPSPPTAATAS
ncbi:hypothetical protein J2W34_006335 [Variovorax boronicumulans]|uniref:hypothetical protein n=1 Tax=Variovorax boronicumulans TaxID=436515 RepID=UPI002787C391|nr:hypothetical protein [Variovorax boronicumulans]MDQ0074511.1 hypothetical protein [Variovorax boronicumulans]